ncbi:2-vinyl bacteriochlorophyllide hydratase [Roseomonas sp. CAU 1739]|uniref:2-vinyl bacteriochlorophyllide hydratase n=1 Tax=Roseomonas sp. CAU 1739 TaxID=3140364 RepID=UPI00325BAC44
MLTTRLLDPLINALDCSPWGSTTGRAVVRPNAWREPPSPLYTPEQRVRRDHSPWTRVQGVLAIAQFGVFLASLGLVLRFLATGDGFAVATVSVCIKTLALYAIMVTGAIWEKEVFGRYLFAHAFFWEDVFSMLVIALHTAYVVAVLAGIGDARMQMLLALAAYGAYVINATQFLMKLRAARRDEPRHFASGGLAS